MATSSKVRGALFALPVAVVTLVSAFAGAANEPAYRQYGIEPIGVRLAAAGYMLDFRYRVTDPELAAPLLNRSVKQQLLVEGEPDVRMIVPTTAKVGSLRQSTRKPEKDRVYFSLFANPGRYLKPGSRVTVEYGPLRITGLEVEG